MQQSTGGAAFAISFSALSTYAECPRRFALRYLADRLPAPQRWTVRQQGRLAPWSTVTGRLVDETLAAVLRRYRSETVWLEDHLGLAMRLASEWWRTSRRALAAQRAGRPGPHPQQWQVLDRHFYQELVTPEEIQQVRRRVRLALQNWWDAPLRDWIAGFPPSSWRAPRQPGEPAGQFRLEGTLVRAAPDFALQTDQETWILDWKCGVPSISAGLRARDQLMIYALLARHAWGIPPDQLRLSAVWLLPDYAVDEYRVTADELDLLAERIRQQHWGLLEKLWLPEDGTDLLDRWPMTDHLPLCRTCVFRGSCPGACRLRALQAAG